MSRVQEIRLLPEPNEVRTDREILKRKKNPEFRKAMDNRELVGEMRYAGGKGLDCSYLTKRECDDSLLRLLAKFVAFLYTKNTEYLVDIAVYAELIYNNSMYNFTPTDQDDEDEQELKNVSTMAALEALINMVRYPNA